MRVMPSRGRMNRDMEQMQELPDPEDFKPEPSDLKTFIAKLTALIADFSALTPDLEEPEPIVASVEPEPSTWTGQGMVMCLCDDDHKPTRRWSAEYENYIEASQTLKASRHQHGLTASAPLSAKETAYAAWQGSLILDDLAADDADALLASLSPDEDKDPETKE